MNEVLSQEEIDKLLTAISEEDTKDKKKRTVPAATPITRYDFNRPVRFSRSQVRAFSRIHEVMAHRLSAELSSLLGISVQIHVESVDQLLFDELTRILPNPTTLVIVEMEPFAGPLLIEIDPATTDSTIDRLMGGSGEGRGNKRVLTDIESALVGWLLPRFFSELSVGWRGYAETVLRGFRIEGHPNYLTLAAPNEAVLLVTMEARIRDVVGMINVAVSYPALRPLLDVLSDPGIPHGSAPSGAVYPVDSGVDIAKLPVETTLWSRLDLTVADLLAMKPGDRIDLPELNDGILHLDAGNRTIHHLRRRNRRGNLFSIDDQGPPSVLSRLRELRGRVPQSEAPVPPDSSVPADPPVSEDDPAEDSDTAAPFSFLEARQDVPMLVKMIHAEHPRTIALILSFLGSATTAEFLGYLQADIRMEIVHRMTILDTVRRDVVAVVESVLRDKQEQYLAERYLTSGGLTYTREVLRAGGEEMREAVLRDLHEEDPDMAEAITRTFASFTDIGRLSDQDLPFLVARIDPWTLTAALAGTGADLIRRIAASLTPAGRKRIMELRSAMDPIEPEAIAAARERVVDYANRMVEFGGTYAL